MVMSISLIDRIQLKERKREYVEKILETDYVSSALLFKFLVRRFEKAEPSMQQWNDTIFNEVPATRSTSPARGARQF